MTPCLEMRKIFGGKFQHYSLRWGHDLIHEDYARSHSYEDTIPHRGPLRRNMKN